MDIIYYLLFALLGLIFGSFGSVLVSRVPKSKPITGRSKCPACKKTLGVRELIPVMSFVLQKGRCMHCKKKISPLYPFLELVSALIFVVAAYLHAIPWIAITLALALWILFVISVIDIRTKLIADGLNIPFIVVAVLYSVFLGELPLTGMAVGGGFFGALWILGRRRWIGTGDILLGLGIGALCGSWQLTIAALFLTYVLGACILSGSLLLGKVSRKDYVPFAPFMALGGYIVVLFRPEVAEILTLYFHL